MTAQRASYAIFALLAIVVGWTIRSREQRRIGLPLDTAHAKTALGALVGAAIGSKLMMILFVDTSQWWDIIGQLQMLDFNGKTVIGGLTGGYIGVEVAKKWVGIRHSTGDAYAIALPTAQSIARLGCLFNGCCYGAPSDASWSIVQHGLARHPAQLYLSIANVVLATTLWRLRNRTQVSGQLFRTYLFGYAALRLFLDPFRGDTKVFLGPLTLVQWYCLLVMVGFGAWLWRDGWRKNRASPKPQAP